MSMSTRLRECIIFRAMVHRIALPLRAGFSIGGKTGYLPTLADQVSALDASIAEQKEETPFSCERQFQRLREVSKSCSRMRYI